MKNLLKVIDDSKTLQILLEKFLIALLIMLATYCINRNLEAFKTRNTIAEVSISKFINSTNDIWKKIDEFEDLTSELCSDAFIYILKEKKNDKYSFQYKSEYAVIWLIFAVISLFWCSVTYLPMLIYSVLVSANLTPIWA